MSIENLDWFSLIFVFGVVVAVAPFLGKYMALVLEGKKTWLTPVLAPLEHLLLKLLPGKYEMGWASYLKAVLLFNFISAASTFLILIYQDYLPFNPLKLPGVPWQKAFNLTCSFFANIGWQSYTPETTLSYFSQMAGLTTQNFFSSATGMCVLAAFIRGFTGKNARTLGNFWADLVRIMFYILLPLSLVLAIFLMSQGVIQNLKPPIHYESLAAGAQVLPQGPAASLVAVKQLSTSGAGFFGSNSAHPFENPTYFSNLLEMVAILLIPFALIFTFGYMIKDKRQAMTLLSVNLIFVATMLSLALWFEFNTLSEMLPGENIMQGKETRIGVTGSVLWSSLTTLTGSGSVNSSFESLSPLTGGICLLNILMGQVIFGSVGSGLYGLLLVAILTVFIAGLMLGRAPEYLGKKIDIFDIQMVIIAILVPSCLILIGTGLAIYFELFEVAGGPRGITQVLYAFASTVFGNGSSFDGIVQNKLSDLILGIMMISGRYIVIIPCLAIAGNLVKKNKTAASFGSFATDNMVFIVLLVGIILIIGSLTFFPALSLGPLAEHILMLKGQHF